MLIALPIVYTLVIANVLISLKYRIFWSTSEVWQRASGMKDVKIRYENISEIRREEAISSEWLAMSRPFHRLVIVGKSSEGFRIVDISLRHFNLNDIHEFISVVKDKRPDLILPEGFA